MTAKPAQNLSLKTTLCFFFQVRIQLFRNRFVGTPNKRAMQYNTILRKMLAILSESYQEISLDMFKDGFNFPSFHFLGNSDS